jgi:hypothetical protein
LWALLFNSQSSYPFQACSTKAFFSRQATSFRWSLLLAKKKIAFLFARLSIAIWAKPAQWFGAINKILGIIKTEIFISILKKSSSRSQNPR